MKGSKYATGSVESRSARVIKVAPVTRAIRAALASSVAAFALTGSPVVLAGTCTAPVANTINCDGTFTHTITYPITDLTLVVGDNVPTTVTPVTGAAGIDAHWPGTVDVTSFADITTDGGDGIHAFGSTSAQVVNKGNITTGVSAIDAMALDVGAASDVNVVNSGNISASTFGVFDVTAVSAESSGVGHTVTVDNLDSGNITAFSAGGTAIDIFAIADQGAVAINNSGSIAATSAINDAIGVFGYAADGSVTITNTGDIDVVGGANGYASQYAGNLGLGDGIFAAGKTVAVDNTGNIAATGYGWAAGIEAQGSDLTTVSNDGTISATVTGYYNNAIGIYTTGGAGGVAVDNSGSITSVGSYATGIDASAGGVIVISNSGDLAVGVVSTGGSYGTHGSVSATGIQASNNYDVSDIAVDNSGSVITNSDYYSTGIVVMATGAGSSGSVTNSGDVQANAALFSVTNGIVVSADGNASIDNAGSITAGNGFRSYGALALAFDGDANVTNAGDIDVTAAAVFGSGYGIVTSSENGASNVDNSGTLAVSAGYLGFGIQSNGMAGMTVNNSGMIDVDAYYAYGVLATSGHGDVVISNADTGVVSVSSSAASATGLEGTATVGDVTIDNAGNIHASGNTDTIGTFARADDGNVSVDNGGDIQAISETGPAIGMFARTTDWVLGEGDVHVGNSGSISALSNGTDGEVRGVLVQSSGVVSVDNSGTIFAVSNAAGGDTVGLLAQADGAVSVTNSGTITATDAAYAVAVSLNSGVASTLTNASTGAITTNSSLEGNIAILDGDGIEKIVNYGYIHGAIASNGGDDQLFNGNGGLWLIDNHATDFGDGDDRIGNGIGGTIQLTGGAISLGNGDDTVANSGSIQVTGGAVYLGDGNDVTSNAAGGTIQLTNSAMDLDDGNDLIGNAGLFQLTGSSLDLGDGDDIINNDGTIQLADSTIGFGAGAGNAFTNNGTIKVLGDSVIDMGTGAQTLVPSLNTIPLVNNGVINFFDGMPGDVLTITGDLGGNGAIDLDVSALNGASDMLYVDGSIADGAVQTVNLAFDGIPTTATTLVPFAHVTGISSSGSFVGGSVIGYGQNNFLDLQVVVSSQLDGTNASDDVFSVGIDVAGLNDTGTLVASIASSAQSLINSQIGTWRQRMGVIPQQDEHELGLGPWIRVFSEKGEVDPAHVADGFGQGGNFRYDQSNWGSELGLNANVLDNINLGVLMTKSEGSQHLINPGIGSDRLDATALGVYGTWISPKGFYVDASYRVISFDADLMSVTGARATSGNADAFNLEAGYNAWTLPSGVKVAPQVQYTRIDVDKIGTFGGDNADLVAEGGNFTRGRLGVAFNKTITGGNFVWTPYGSINAVREFDGQARYLVGDRFSGSISTKGTSALVELGLGAQKGGLAISAGASWTDGGAMHSFVGGQFELRYRW